ncbi:metal-dependent transcriptional regulator [Lacicoccus qingdaonensis]|uniref:metal-dependent transcriptional regulator n=1 Tax=Lacicoccus qingdaonensis TaxID=576118 RepID=UPI001FE0654F|nr:metal-dependent transcriptional regulator [Salinicoccus qingdaonensis]
MDDLSPTKEDYIKVLFELGGRFNRVSNKEVSNRLDISPPTVTEMMNSLVKVEWVEYTPYKGSILTDKGTEYAKEIIRKHRLWEVFLFEKLGFDIEDVHAEAELLEHTTSDDVADKLESYLGYPEYCPHGGAIKIDLMDMQEDYTFTISEAKAGTEVVISRIVDEEKLLKYFKNQHLNIGDRITVTDIDSSIDLITLTAEEDKEIQISISLGNYLFVEPI